jgi:hypothetical protein
MLSEHLPDGNRVECWRRSTKEKHVRRRNHSHDVPFGRCLLGILLAERTT